MLSLLENSKLDKLEKLEKLDKLDELDNKLDEQDKKLGELDKPVELDKLNEIHSMMKTSKASGNKRDIKGEAVLQQIYHLLK